MTTESLLDNEERDQASGGNGQHSKPIGEHRIQTAAEPVPDPFDPAALRLGQDFAASVGVKKVLTTVPCRKPNRHEFVRVRPGESWRLETAAFEDKVTRDTYLVRNDLGPSWPAKSIRFVCS